MINIIALRIFADEYIKILKQLLSEEHYIATQKKDAFSRLAAEYRKLPNHSDVGPMYVMAVRTALSSDASAMAEAIRNVSEREGRGHEELNCQILQMKIVMIEGLLKEYNISPLMKEKSIEFKNDKGDVIMNCPL